MVLQETKKTAPQPSRLEKRQSLKIIDGIGRETVKDLFQGFVFTPEQEHLAERYAWDQLVLLTEIAHKQDPSKLKLYGELMTRKDVLGYKPELDQVIQVTNESASEYAIMCYYQGKAVKEVNYNIKDHKINSVSDFFYFKRTLGGEGLLEVRSHPITPNERTEVIYTLPIDQQEFANYTDRDSWNAFVLTGNGAEQELSMRTITSDDRFLVEESIIFQNRQPAEKTAIYRETNNPNNRYSFQLSFEKDMPPSLIVEEFVAYEKKSRYWVFVPDPTKQLDYEYLLEDLADGYTPDQDQALDFIFSLTVDDKNDTVVANLEGEELIGVQPGLHQLVPEEFTDLDAEVWPWIFRTNNNQKTLVVCLGEYGIGEFFFELGRLSEDSQLN